MGDANWDMSRGRGRATGDRGRGQVATEGRLTSASVPGAPDVPGPALQLINVSPARRR